MLEISEENLKLYFEPIDQQICPMSRRDGDAGYDMYTTEDTWLLPWRINKVPLNCKIEIPTGYTGIVTSRSGMMLNGNFTLPGVIDENYRGQLSAVVKRFGMPKRLPKGTRIAQLLIIPIAETDNRRKQITENTNRGSKGFGSSGTR